MESQHKKTFSLRSLLCRSEEKLKCLCSGGTRDSSKPQIYVINNLIHTRFIYSAQVSTMRIQGLLLAATAS